MRSYVEANAAGDHHLDYSLAANRLANLSRRSLLQWGAGLMASAVFAGRTGPAGATRANRPSTSRAARQEAIRELPLRSLKEPLQSQIRQIVLDPTIYRRLPIEVIPCDPQLYLFLVRYPEVVVNMWQLMGVTQAVIKRTSAYAYDARDGAGTVSEVQLVYGTRDQHLFLAEGYYDGPLLPRRVTGRCALLLTSAYSDGEQQRSYISNRLDVFLQLDRVGVELVAKTLHPLLGRTIDTNFAESARFVGQVSFVAENNGPGVQRLASRLDNVQPQVRAKFARLASSINQRAALRQFETDSDDESQRVSDRHGDASLKAITERK